MKSATPRPGHTDNAIEVNDLVKSFRRPGHSPLRAVDHVCLTIPTGSIVAVLGPNGAGKSTTIDMILGMIAPTHGTVSVLGQAPQDAARSGRVGVVFQGGGLLPDFTVRETLEVIAAAHGASDHVAQMIEEWNLADVAGTKVKKCSGGQQQRLRFAMALVSQPELIILDEPTTGLDVEARRHFWQKMREQAEQGRTIVFATHYLREADVFAERVVLMAHGRIVADGPVDEIRGSVAGSRVEFTTDEAADLAERVRSFPGTSEVNQEGNRLEVRTSNSDELARFLLDDTTAHDLRISTNSLEDVFVQLTSDEEQS